MMVAEQRTFRAGKDVKEAKRDGKEAKEKEAKSQADKVPISAQDRLPIFKLIISAVWVRQFPGFLC